MKKVIDVNIGGINFTIEDDAYIKLKAYLSSFEASLPREDVREIMEDVEIRVAELFQKEINYPNQIIGMKAVDNIITCMGEIEVNSNVKENETIENKMKAEKKLYRNPDDKRIAGVCSGLGAYFNIDPTLVRILFVVLLLGYGSALIAYIILWIVMPEAVTVVQKLEMRGAPVTAENIRDYNTYKK